MASARQIEETYDFMDEVFRLSFGEHADLTCALYDGDGSKSLLQAQRDKHDYILESIHFRPGARVLDIGCGFGPVLNAVRERGGRGVGLTLSRKQAAVCRRFGLEVYARDWKDVAVDEIGTFDGIVSVGAFEHFCSPEEHERGEQDQIYSRFFQLCHGLLPSRGRLYLQTMMFGRNAPPREAFSFQAQRGSPEYIGAVAMAFFPGSWLPSGEEQILRTATPFFRLVDAKNGRLDYVRTIAAWSRMWSFTWGNFAPGRFSAPRLVAVSKLVPRFLTDADFRRRTEFLRKGYDRICFQDELIDHQRLVFEKL